VSRVARGGAAAAAGCLFVGDRLESVDGPPPRPPSPLHLCTYEPDAPLPPRPTLPAAPTAAASRAGLLLPQGGPSRGFRWTRWRPWCSARRSGRARARVGMYGVRDAACPLSTGGGTRLVRLVRGRGGGCARARALRVRALSRCPSRWRRRRAGAAAGRGLRGSPRADWLAERCRALSFGCSCADGWASPTRSISRGERVRCEREGGGGGGRLVKRGGLFVERGETARTSDSSVVWYPVCTGLFNREMIRSIHPPPGQTALAADTPSGATLPCGPVSVMAEPLPFSAWLRPELDWGRLRAITAARCERRMNFRGIPLEEKSKSEVEPQSVLGRCLSLLSSDGCKVTTSCSEQTARAARGSLAARASRWPVLGPASTVRKHLRLVALLCLLVLAEGGTQGPESRRNMGRGQAFSGKKKKAQLQKKHSERSQLLHAVGRPLPVAGPAATWGGLGTTCRAARERGIGAAESNRRRVTRGEVRRKRRGGRRR
jgi:hypothetical protein